ncbi:MAG: radical SAM protein [Calditrichia bacterium]|nr:radical SAM protein [Calditrichia bacterium]
MPSNTKNSLLVEKENSLGQKIKINEIFYSIQGESSFSGLPCIFIRFTNCNLRCSYCDTEYAFYDGKELTIDEIVKQVKVYDCQLVEITGGEPLIQKNIFPLIQELLKNEYEILLETGGHIDISKVDKKVKIIMDLKCPSSGESEKNLWSNLEKLIPTTEIKFVIGNKIDFDWAISIVNKYKITQNNRILFSPVFDKLNNEELANWILESKLPIRMQLQMHKYIWDPNKKGV